MDVNNPVIQLCMEGTRAEFEHRLETHVYIINRHGRRAALEHADTVKDERVKEFYPSLYVNLGQAYEDLGDQAKAQSYYQLAAGLGLIHQPD